MAQEIIIDSYTDYIDDYVNGGYPHFYLVQDDGSYKCWAKNGDVVYIHYLDEDNETEFNTNSAPSANQRGGHQVQTLLKPNLVTEHIFEYATNATYGVTMNINGLTTPQDFKISVPTTSGEYKIITNLSISIIATSLDPESFPGKATILGNALRMHFTYQGTTTSYQKIINTAGIIQMFGGWNNSNIHMYAGSKGKSLLQASFALTDGFRMVNGDTTEIKITVNNDLSHLTQCYVMAYGYTGFL